jgi:hypothetical protein
MSARFLPKSVGVTRPGSTKTRPEDARVFGNRLVALLPNGLLSMANVSDRLITKYVEPLLDLITVFTQLLTMAYRADHNATHSPLLRPPTEMRNVI